jgi:8-oxo-dGTP pyrophosphatase MutT (NUDIX family)
MSRPPFNESTLREPLRALLASRTRHVAPDGAGKASAVLAPVFERAGEAHLLFVSRAQGMREHSGQIAFPGGKHDPEDASLLATALREAEEEIGLRPADVDVLGGLDDYRTITGYVITPYVGWIRDDHAFSPNPAEVARVLTSPLRAFLEPPAGTFPRIGWRIEGELLWGATAAIVASLATIARELVASASSRP